MKDDLLARLILNTKRKDRIDCLFDIAKDIRILEKQYGSIKSLASAIGLSTNMLNRFLSVEKLDGRFRELVSSKKLNNINVIYYIQRYNYQDQEILINKYLQKEISSHDIRALGSLKNAKPDSGIIDLINQIKRSKKIKVSVILIEKSDLIDEKIIKKNLDLICFPEDIIDIQSYSDHIKIRVTDKGLVKIKSAAKVNRMSLFDFAYFIAQHDYEP